MIRIFLIIAAACVAVPALAQLPDYDTARRCTQFAQGNRTVEDQCRRDEADARQEIERSRVSPEILPLCKERVQSEQSYVLLYGCTLNDAEAKTDRRRIAPIPVGPMNIPAVNTPTLSTGAGSRPLPPAVSPGSVTVMRGSETTIEKPSRR
jgi:hypothetical protein